MKGADEFATILETGQYGRLYLVSSFHARGPTFRVFVLPDGEEAIPNGRSNGPLNSDAVEVYGITGGHPGWTEWYGWIHKGEWQIDFAKLVERRREEIANYEAAQGHAAAARMSSETERTAGLLSLYK